MNFEKSLTPPFLARKFTKNASFYKLILKFKSWILILKDFGFSNIFIEFK